MSVEQAKAFIEKMKTDEAFHEKIMAIKTSEERLNAIEEAGFVCTGEEINEAGGAEGAWLCVCIGSSHCFTC